MLESLYGSFGQCLQRGTLSTRHTYHKELQSHMQHQHPDSIDDGQLDSLTKMVARPAVNLKFSCPLCCSERSSDLNIDRLEQHLGRHVEVIATFALPQGGMESPESQRSAATQDANLSDKGDGGTDNLGDDPKADDRSQSSDALSAVSLSNIQDDVIDDSNEDRGFLSAPVLESVVLPKSLPADGFATEMTTNLPFPDPLWIDNTIEALRICDWLTTDAQTRLFARFAAMGQPGTGVWFMQSESYAQWRRADLEVLLVEAGCGKTVLATIIIQELANASQHHAFYFFEPKLASQLPLETPIRSLVAQLLQQTRHVPSDLRDLRESYLASGLEPSLDQLLEILRIMFRLDENETFLVLDGLEAINTNMLKMLVRIIFDAMVQGSRVRLLATSRINSSFETAIKFGPQDYHVNGFY
ncbi:MAG: hypothetical protein Q9228_002287 [Teloschistes exilis]